MRKCILMLMLLLVAPALVTAFSPALSEATTYYVGPRGNDTTGNGTSRRPWYTLSKACSVARASGDVIRVAAGNYTDNRNCILEPGVSIEGAGKSVTIVTTACAGYYISAVSPVMTVGNNTISGISFRGGSSRTTRRSDGCIRFQRRHNSVIRDCDIMFFESPTTGEGNAVEFLGDVNWDPENTVPPQIWMDGCKLYNCRIIACHRDNIYRAAVTVLGLANLEIHDTVFDETGTGGFCLKGSPGWLKGAKIYRNTFTVDPYSVIRTERLNVELWNICADSEIYGNTFTNGYISFVSGQTLGGSVTFTFRDNVVTNGIKSEFSVSNHQAFRNRFIHPGHRENDNGSGIGFWTSHGSSVRELRNIRWAYNEFIDMYGESIVIQDKLDQDGTGSVPIVVEGLDIFNNVFDKLTVHGSYSAAIAISSVVAGSSFTNVRLSNNIFTDMARAILCIGNTDVMTGEIRNNLFYLVETDMVPNEVAGMPFTDNLSNLNPLFVDPSSGDYGLTPGSPCIDAGKDMGYPYFIKYGPAYDVGAHEFVPQRAPVAYAGPDQIVSAGTAVSLDGTKSYDGENDPLTYRWTQTQGPSVVLSDPTAAAPFFTAPQVASPQVLQFQLVVSDGLHTSFPSTVSVTVNPVISPPVANFSGTPLTGPSPLTVRFTDSSSGTLSGWLWDFGDGSSSTDRNPTHTYTGPGSYTVTLSVSGPGGSNSRTVADFVNVAPAIPPSVTITSPKPGDTFSGPVTILLSATANAGSGAAVARVEFYSGSTLLGSVVASPYAYTWSNVPAGSHTLTARVIDTLGNTAVSEPVPVTVTAADLPAPWTTADIGTVGIAGSADYVDGLFSVSGGGTDIWGTADGFRYVYHTLSGDGTIIARVVYQQNTNQWAKAGVMIRESLSSDSAHALVAVTPVNGAAFQRRLTTGSYSLHTQGPYVAAPYWVRLVRSGATFSGYISANGVTWTFVGSATIAMANDVLVGLAVTSHDTTVASSAKIAGVSVTGSQVTEPTVILTKPTVGDAFVAPATIALEATAAPGRGASVSRVEFYNGATLLGSTAASPYGYVWNDVPAGNYSLTAKVIDTLGGLAVSTPVTVTVTAGGLPSPWLTSDIGGVGVVGSAGYLGGVFSISGAGADIWGTADGFRYVYQTLSGDGEIVARVVSQQNTNQWAKAGVMIRETLTADSPHALMAITPVNGAAFQRRLTTGALSLHTQGQYVGSPYWVRLVRNGSIFSGYISRDGVVWTLVGSATIPMGNNVYVGLAVTSHDTTVASSVVMDGVAMTPGQAALISVRGTPLLR